MEPLRGLRAFRQLVGASQQEVSRETGVSQSTISRIESGKRTPRLSFEAVASILEWADRVARRKRIPLAQRLLGAPHSSKRGGRAA